MALDPEIQAAVNLIERRIAKLQQAKDLLIGEFSRNGTAQTDHAETVRAGQVRVQHQMPLLSPKTRKAQIRDFILAAGASRRSEIVEKTGIPEGTVSYVLNDDKVFRHIDSTGKWDVVKEIRDGLNQPDTNMKG